MWRQPKSKKPPSNKHPNAPQPPPTPRCGTTGWCPVWPIWAQRPQRLCAGVPRRQPPRPLPRQQPLLPKPKHQQTQTKNRWQKPSPWPKPRQRPSPHPSAVPNQPYWSPTPRLWRAIAWVSATNTAGLARRLGAGLAVVSVSAMGWAFATDFLFVFVGVLALATGVAGVAAAEAVAVLARLRTGAGVAAPKSATQGTTQSSHTEVLAVVGARSGACLTVVSCSWAAAT